MLRPALPMFAVAALAAGAAHAQTCPIRNVDLAPAMKLLAPGAAVLTATRKNADSGEPVMRTVAEFTGGASIVVEQQNCQMSNLRVTLLSPAEAPGKGDLRLFAAALGATPVWKRYFKSLDPSAFVQKELDSAEFRAGKAKGKSFDYPINGRLSAAGETSEATLGFMSTNSYPATFKSVLSLYIGVGGAD